MKENIKKDIEADREAERKELIDEWINNTISTIRDHKVNTKTIEVGKFVIRVQTTCELTLPPKPEVPTDPVTLECLEGRYQGEILAKAVANLTKENPTMPRNVMMRMGHCELSLEKEIGLTIFHDCAIEDFESYYEKYFNELIVKMENKGYTYNENDKSFSKKSEQIITGE